MSTDSFFLSHPDPMWVYDLDTLCFLAVNDAAVARYGYAREEFLAMTIADIRPHEDRPALAASVASVTEGRGEGGVWRHCLKSGEIIHVDITGHTIEYQGRRAELIAARDVTENVGSANALAQAKRMLEIAGNSAKFGAWRYDVRADRLEWSSQTARIHDEPDGFSPHVADGIAYFIPEHRERISALFQSCLEHGTPFDETLQIVTAKGRRLSVRSTGEADHDKSGVIIAVQGSIQDVSELVTVRKRAEESERLLAIAGRAVKLGGWRVTLDTQKVSWTDGTAAIHELPPGTPPTLKDGIDYFAPEERESAAKVFEDCARHGIPFDNVRDLITVKGNRVRVRSMGVPVRDDTGRIIAVEGAMQDITELTIVQREADELGRRLAETLENFGDAFYTLDHDWRFTYLNSKAEVLLERERDGLIGRKIVDEFPEFAGSAFDTQFRHALATGETVQIEQFYPPLDRTFRVSTHSTPAGLAVYFSDITEERRRDEQLRLLEAAVERINDIVLITKIGESDASVDPTVVYVNNAFEEITGFSREEAIGKTPRILQGPKTQRSELDRIRKAVEMRLPVQAELVNYTKSGQEYWLELDIVPLANEAGSVTHFVAVQRDVTDRRTADEALRLSEMRFRRIAEATGIAVWEWDIPGGRVSWSDGMTGLFGHESDPEGSLAPVWRANVHPDDGDRIDASLGRLLSGETDTVNETYRFRRADGTWADVENHAILIRDEDGRAARVLGSMSDISEKVAIQERLRQSQKLEAVGQLTGGVAHDFNNLLTIIIGNTEMLQDSLDESDPLRRFADMSAAAADRAAELINRLLVFSRKQTLQSQVIDINSVISGIADMLRRTLGEDIDVEIALAEALWATETDLAQIEAALLNLAINSRNAMPDGGSLTIETANVALDDDYVATEPGLRPGQYVLIAVSDSGHGIPKDQIDRVFEPFFTTKPEGLGTGLGLSMVYGFVKQTGGHVRIYSEPDQGTTVKLYFPRFSGETLANGKERQSMTELHGQETILAVEDDALILQQLKAQLAGLGYRVVTASAGAPALDILRDRSDIDLLFTDVVLPGGMNGRQIVEAARKIRPGLKVLYTSGYSENAFVHQGRLDQGVQLLSKPYRRSELASKIRKALDC